MTTDTRPSAPTPYRPVGYSTLTPLLVVSPAAEAVDFYTDVLDARVTSRMNGPDGSVWHCELELEDGRLQVMDANEQFHAVANDPGSDDARFSIAVYVPDVDATLARAVARGARVREEAADFEVTGDRFASVQDPYGVRWTIMTRVAQRDDEQVQQALDAWAASMG
ncbi:VOC family protein [Ornithinimicrobium avium]|uniref:VOC family protein n=1 Tax=Ornithinimicrobium avium TaxID=2283195 RepID=A0A345NQL2_9MICO|nr:VOC family protein [Ornithinimicrobium avium]AXH97320.1 VOC family protein [Ornithinimicrobium avium]